MLWLFTPHLFGHQGAAVSLFFGVLLLYSSSGRPEVSSLIAMQQVGLIRLT